MGGSIRSSPLGGVFDKTVGRVLYRASAALDSDDASVKAPSRAHDGTANSHPRRANYSAQQLSLSTSSKNDRAASLIASLWVGKTWTVSMMSSRVSPCFTAR